jgi:hypothetical protein
MRRAGPDLRLTGRTFVDPGSGAGRRSCHPEPNERRALNEIGTGRLNCGILFVTEKRAGAHRMSNHGQKDRDDACGCGPGDGGYCARTRGTHGARCCNPDARARFAAR